MTIFDDMEAKKRSFTRTDNQIYATIRKFPDEVATNNINAIVEAFGISQSSLTRFAKKLGFSGFAEFQYVYKIDLQRIKDSPGMIRAQQYSDLFFSLESSISKKTIHDLAEKMLHSHIVYTAGASIAQIPCSYLFSLSQIVGSFISIRCSTDEIITHMREDDIFILFSAYSGTMFKNGIQHINEKEKRPYEVLVTFNPKHALRNDFDEVIVLPSLDTPGNGSSAAAEPISYLFFIDLLVNEMSEIKQDEQSNTN